MSNLARVYTMLPALPQAGVLDRYQELLGVIVPVARTNLITNPSFETNTTNWTASGGSIARSTSQQYHGAYSLAITPTAGTTDGAYFGTVSLTSGTTYAVSCKVLGQPGIPYKLSVATTGGVDLITKTFIGTGSWQWIWLFWQETSTTTRRISLTKNTSANTGVFYLDGVQVEACGSEGVCVTTYIDGDQAGYVANQSPPAYLWSGTRHASSSSRSGQTRAGGRIVKFQDLGFLLTAIIGLGMSSPKYDTLNFAQLDGAQYRNAIKQQRSFSFVGRWQGADPTQMDAGIGKLGRLLDRDRIGLRQELALCLQARECNADSGEPLIIPRAVYASGLDGNVQELPVAAANITFTQYLPFVVGRDGGVALDIQDSASVAGIVQRAPSGAWGTLAGGVGSPYGVYDLARGLDQTLYAGGNFLNAGGNANADYIAQWNGSAWVALPSGSAALNNQVLTLSIGPSGTLYAGGEFTDASGIAAADYIASWNGSAWSALGTGPDAGVMASAVGPDGTLYIGGSFLNVNFGTRQYFASWNGSAWSGLGSTTAFNGSVQAIAVGPDGSIYVGGGFTDVAGVANADYVAKWNGSAWVALGTGLNDTVFALAVGPNGILYAGGTFTAAGGLSIPYIAQWNGQQWSALGSGINGSANSIYVAPNGFVYVGGGLTVAGGVTLADRAAIWTGSTWIPLDIDLPGASDIKTVLVDPDGTLTIGFQTTGTATYSGLATATNNGSAQTYPVLTITGPSSGTSRIYQIVNATTNTAIYFNYTINAGEVATLVLDPQNLSFTSTFRGNIYNTILPGSQTTLFALQPGADSISMFAANSTVTASLSWQTRYTNVNDALYQAAGDP